MAGTMPKLQNTNTLRATYGTVLSYGPAGAGKTRSIGTLQKAKMNPLILATEIGETGGLLSLVGLGVPFLKVTSHEELIQVIRDLRKKPGKVEYEGTEFGAVVLDSVTAWGEFPLERFMELKGWTDLHGVASGKDPRAAYGFLAEKGRQLYKGLFALSAHLYIIAREGLFGGGDEALFAAPELPGQKLPREMPGWSDSVVRLRVIAGKFLMITRGEGGSPGRTRLPESMKPLPLRANPDIGALIKYMCGDESVYPLLDPTPEKEVKK